MNYAEFYLETQLIFLDLVYFLELFGIRKN